MSVASNHAHRVEAAVSDPPASWDYWNDSPAVIVGDDAVDRQRLDIGRAGGSCCNMLGVSFVLGVCAVAGVRRGLEIHDFDSAIRSCRSTVARMAGD